MSNTNLNQQDDLFLLQVRLFRLSQTKWNVDSKKCSEIFNKYKITNLENQINVIFNYFNALKTAYENSHIWYNKTINPFFTNAGFVAAIEVLNRVLIAKCAAEKDFTLESFVKQLKLDATLLQNFWKSQ